MTSLFWVFLLSFALVSANGLCTFPPKYFHIGKDDVIGNSANVVLKTDKNMITAFITIPSDLGYCLTDASFWIGTDMSTVSSGGGPIPGQFGSNGTVVSGSKSATLTRNDMPLDCDAQDNYVLVHIAVQTCGGSSFAGATTQTGYAGEIGKLDSAKWYWYFMLECASCIISPSPSPSPSRSPSRSPSASPSPSPSPSASPSASPSPNPNPSASPSPSPSPIPIPASTTTQQTNLCTAYGNPCPGGAACSYPVGSSNSLACASSTNCTQPTRFGLGVGKVWMPGASAAVAKAPSGKLEVTFTLPTSASAGTDNSLWCINEVQVWLGAALSGVPAANGNPVPGQFPYKALGNGAKTVTVEAGDCSASPMQVVAHVAIYQCNPGQPTDASSTVTGYAGGSVQSGDGAKWWNSFTLGSCEACPGAPAFSASPSPSPSPSWSPSIAPSASPSPPPETCDGLTESYTDYRLVDSGVSPKCSLESAMSKMAAYGCSILRPGCKVAICSVAVDRAVINSLEDACGSAAQ